MAFPLRATQFYEGTVSSASYTTVYTVPTGHRIILKSINARNRRSSSQSAFVRTASGTEIWNVSIPASVAAQWSGWIVLNEGESIQAASSVSPWVDFIFSGTIHYI